MSLLNSLAPRPRPTARQKLRAAVARRAALAPSIEDEEEPTTSFKTALIVVVLLHLVAAGGVYMFDSIKTHRPSLSETSAPVSAKSKKAAASEAAASGNAASVAAAAQGATNSMASTAAARPKASAPASTPAAEVKKPAATAASTPAVDLKDSGQSYTVAKGDTLVTISKKLHVVYDDLCKLNKIEDPKKLRIGQKLRVPAKQPRTASN
ncbi:MAG: LysM peptidoglycan-binding domain-containing protein [Chthoniobacteraceae bacterium]